MPIKRQALSETESSSVCETSWITAHCKNMKSSKLRFQLLTWTSSLNKYPCNVSYLQVSSLAAVQEIHVNSLLGKQESLPFQHTVYRTTKSKHE